MKYINANANRYIPLASGWVMLFSLFWAWIRSNLIKSAPRVLITCLSSCVYIQSRDLRIPAWISNYTHYKVWDEITCPFPNFNGGAVEAWEWISNFIPHFSGHVITYPCWLMQGTGLVIDDCARALLSIFYWSGVFVVVSILINFSKLHESMLMWASYITHLQRTEQLGMSPSSHCWNYYCSTLSWFASHCNSIWSAENYWHQGTLFQHGWIIYPL